MIEKLARAASSHMTVVTEEAASVERQGERFVIRLGGEAVEADAVVLACQAYEAGELLRSLDGTLAEQLGTVPYNSSVTVSLGYKRDSFDGHLHGFGFLVPRKERRRLVACTFVGTKFPYRVPEDKVMLRCFLGGAQESALGDSDQTVVSDVRAELRDILGIAAEPAFARVSRWPRSMAQYTVGHKRRVEAIEARLKAIPGLYVAGNAYTGIGVPDCARMGKQAAEKIVSNEPAAPAGR